MIIITIIIIWPKGKPHEKQHLQKGYNTITLVLFIPNICFIDETPMAEFRGGGVYFL